MLNCLGPWRAPAYCLPHLPPFTRWARDTALTVARVNKITFWGLCVASSRNNLILVLHPVTLFLFKCRPSLAHAKANKSRCRYRVVDCTCPEYQFIGDRHQFLSIMLMGKTSILFATCWWWFIYFQFFRLFAEWKASVKANNVVHMGI